MTILDDVKNKKEFRGLSDEFISRILVKLSKKYDVLDKKQRKELVKQTRARLRELHAAFRMRNYGKKEKILEEMTKWDDKHLCQKIMQVHLSTRERVPYYEELYSWLKRTTDFKTVLDLGCGLNVFSLPWIGQIQYYGIDVNKDEITFCNSYLDKFSLPGAVRWGDLLSFDKFMKADITFIFKVLDGLESIERGSTEKLLKKITSKYIVVSFATRSLGGKKAISTKRLKWFEKLIENYDKKKIGDEIYYLIKR
jgi:16S rRNA (guanine(1405)-N(7))-methyltransferase